MAMSVSKPVLFLTNDDGVSPDSAIILPLAQRLVNDGNNVVVCAPGLNNSACGMRITLSEPNTLRRHLDLEKQFGCEKRYEDNFKSERNINIGSLYVFSVDSGTPCDCVIVGIEPKTGLLGKMGFHPRLVSGINVGQNLGTDIFYSGTFSAARQASIYGIPSVALSLNIWTRSPMARKHKLAIDNALSAASMFIKRASDALPTYLPDPGLFSIPCSVRATGIERPYSISIDSQKSIQARLEDAFSRGDFVLNVNIPTDWDGTFAATSLDSVLYRSIIDLESIPSGIAGSEDEVVTFSFSGKNSDKLQSEGSDIKTLMSTKACSVSPVSTWPLCHALTLSEKFFHDALGQSTTFWEVPAARS